MSYQNAAAVAVNTVFRSRFRLALVRQALTRFGQPGPEGERQLVREILIYPEIAELRVEAAAWAGIAQENAVALLSSKAADHITNGVVDIDGLQGEITDAAIQSFVVSTAWPGLIRS